MPANSRFHTLQDVIAAAKSDPGKLTYAHAGIGGATHVGMEQFAMAAGVKFNAIAYKGGSQALQDVLAGQVDLLADSSSWAPHVEAGKLRLLATWGEQRTPRFASAPTLKELGFNVGGGGAQRHRRPQGLPPAIEKTLRDAFRAAVAKHTSSRPSPPASTRP